MKFVTHLGKTCRTLAASCCECDGAQVGDGSVTMGPRGQTYTSPSSCGVGRFGCRVHTSPGMGKKLGNLAIQGETSLSSPSTDLSWVSSFMSNGTSKSVPAAGKESQHLEVRRSISAHLPLCIWEQEICFLSLALDFAAEFPAVVRVR